MRMKVKVANAAISLDAFLFVSPLVAWVAVIQPPTDPGFRVTETRPAAFIVAAKLITKKLVTSFMVRPAYRFDDHYESDLTVIACSLTRSSVA